MGTGVLTVWLAKFNKARHVPLAPTATSALVDYRQACRHFAPVASTRALFVTPRGRRLGYCGFRDVFDRLRESTGIASAGSRPRIHDFRHTFAVRTLLGWYRDGADVHALLPRLSTYLGHVDPASTYWYLSAAPELMALVAERLERSREGSR